MKFVDLNFENKIATKLSFQNFQTIENSGKYLLGKFLEELEIKFAKDQNYSHAACVKNATDALFIILKLLEADKKTVIVPQFGAYPTVMAAIQAGAKKIIAAPINQFFTLDLKKVEVPKNSIIIPVHLFGNNAASSQIFEIAKSTDSLIIEDCAQSTGLHKNKESFAAIHSFYPTKPLGCRGDGGAILSDDEDFINRVKKSRFYGFSQDFEINEWGCNSRMDEWQAAFLLEKIAYYRSMNETRRKNAKLYNHSLGEISQSLQTEDCIFHQYVTLWKNRDEIQRVLQEKFKIPTMIHYPKLISDMPFIRDKIKISSCKRVNDHILSIPVGPHLSDVELKLIMNSLHELRNETIDFCHV